MLLFGKLMSLFKFSRSIFSIALATALCVGTTAGFLKPSQVAAAFPGTNGKISITQFPNGNADIIVVNSDGTGSINLTNNPAADNNSNWSADGTKIVFNTSRDAGDNEIYTMNPDGNGLTRLTNVTGTDSNAEWSPNGSRIVFQTTRDGNNEIYVMNADGTNPVRITNNSGSDTSPNYSPDGTKLTFDSTRDGNQEIYTMNADGTNQTRLTTDPAYDRLPAWSPDGAKIVFDTGRSSNNIFTMNADGTGQATIGVGGLSANWQPIPYPSRFSPPAGNASTTNAPVCNDAKPASAPNLFQINTASSTAKLFFAPAGNPVNKYFVAYGPKPENLIYGVEFPQGYSSGVLSYQINLLKPSTTYYFKIRGGNGCMPGEWSSLLKARTGFSKTIINSYYPAKLIR